mgnify:CR=1 FL=1
MLSVALSYDDVLMVPKRGLLASRDQVSLETNLCSSIKLKMPIISSNMDTITEDEMAIAMAQMGGLGIIHRYCSIDEQVLMIAKVKRADNFIITDPYTILESENVNSAKLLMSKKKIGSLIVLKNQVEVSGMITTRDLYFKDGKDYIKNAMTPLSHLVCDNPGESMTTYQSIMTRFKIKKLPLLNTDGSLAGLVCIKDIFKRQQYPNATRDSLGRLMVGGAIGFNDLERAKVLIAYGVDTIVIDVAHGHCTQMIKNIKEFKMRFPNVPLGVGNVATYEGFLDLAKAGADWIKASVGAGSICKTRIITGFGVPGFQTILWCAKCKKDEKYKHVGLVADGGLKNSGDIAKAIGAGADAVMLGSLLGGTDESPGMPILKDGKKVKIIRGMAGIGANWDRTNKKNDKIVPEGVEAFIEYKGSVIPVLEQLMGGLKSAVSYSGTSSLREMRSNVEFVQQTAFGSRESNVHDVHKF